MKNLGAYIHIPFCISKCNYCDFNSYANIWDREDAYFSALTDEIINKSGHGEYLVDTIYFGGGTPSAVKCENIGRVLDALKQRFYISDNCEATVECNPATADFEKLRMLRNLGLNRISIGMQSADDEQLKTLGRAHSFEDCRICVRDARAAGFENLSLDLMFGLPVQDLDSWKRSLDAAVALEPQHISCYALKIEDGTPFAKMDLNIADDDESAEMYEYATAFLSECGFDRYEISNFAKAGYESRHNLKYWRLDEYAGFGAGAHSFLDGCRFANERDVAGYTEGAPFECITESANDLMSEFVYLGLRLDCGISESEFSARFGRSISEVFGDEIRQNTERGTLELAEGRIKIPPRYAYVSNSIMSDFIL